MGGGGGGAEAETDRERERDRDRETETETERGEQHLPNKIRESEAAYKLGIPTPTPCMKQ